MHDRHTDELEELEARQRERQDRADRQADHAPAPVTPIDSRRRPTIDVDELERARAAAGPRIRSSAARLRELGADQYAGDPGTVVEGPRAEATVSYIAPTMAELERRHGLTPAPRLVLAGDLADEIERQHRRAYHRRQEANARAARRRRAVETGRDLLVMALASGGIVLGLALGIVALDRLIH